MNLVKRIDALGKIREVILARGDRIRACVDKTYQDNPWFTRENIWNALDSISGQFLDPQKLIAWTSKYDIPEDHRPAVGIIMAGNLPLVGFHDWLAVFVSGSNSMVKLSSKDPYLLPFLLRESGLNDDPSLPNTDFVDTLKGMDAIIATGSDNSSRYFEYYFGKYPHIIRKNRTSLGVITGNESDEQLKELGKDVFRYFGMGCRSVSALRIPEGFDLDRIFSNWIGFSDLMEHSKYRHNYEYNYSVYVLNNIPFLTNNVVMLKEDDGWHPPLSVVFYKHYSKPEEVEKEVRERESEIQCVVSGESIGDKPVVSFGQAQSPGLFDYADHIDTMQFLSSL